MQLISSYISMWNFNSSLPGRVMYPQVLGWGRASQGGSVVKNPPDDAGAAGNVVPIPGRGNGNPLQYPLQYSCLKNPMDRGAWWATVHGVAKSRTRLSTRAQRWSRGCPLKVIVLSTYHTARNTSPLNTAPGERRPRPREKEMGEGSPNWNFVPQKNPH